MSQTQSPFSAMGLPGRFSTLVLAFGIVMVMAGCLTSDDSKKIEGTGTVRYQSIEGGFYGIVGDDGKHYDPINLPEDLAQDGVRIRFRAELREDRVSFHMWGAIVELKQVDRLP